MHKNNFEIYFLELIILLKISKYDIFLYKIRQKTWFIFYELVDNIVNVFYIS